MRLRSSASSHLFYSFSARMARGSRRFCALYAAPSRLTTITSQQRRSFSKENLCSHQRFCQGTASAVPYSSRPRAALAAEVRSPVRSAGSQFQYNRSIAHFFLSPPIRATYSHLLVTHLPSRRKGHLSPVSCFATMSALNS